MKKYVLILSRTFPKGHPRAGQPTEFNSKVLKAIEKYSAYDANQLPRYPFRPKLHTIRGNYELWRKRFEEIDKGNACLVLKQWSGVPYRSKQETIAVLTKEDGIGLQRLNFYRGNILDALFYPSIEDVPSDVTILAESDGLNLNDWITWFKDADLSEPFAIIHFTKFRY